MPARSSCTRYSHAWVDFARWRDPDPPHDWFANSRLATIANQRYCLSLRDRFPGYDQTLWGVTASDARDGYKAWGGPPHDPQVDGTVVPCAAAGSLMFDADVTLPALLRMRGQYGHRVWGRYGFADAFHPTADWVNPDVIGIDLGITLLSLENARSGNVWKWFMANPEIGTDNRSQLTAFARAWARDEARARDGAYVVVPQMPSRSATYSGPAEGDGRTSEGTPLVAATLALLDTLVDALPIDRQRIGVIGFSMGASTTWALLHERPGFFSAAIPIAGVPRADQAASVRPATRIWVIHGNRDETNPIRHDRRAFVPLAEAGATIRFSEIDHLGHDVPPVWLADGTLAAFLLQRR